MSILAHRTVSCWLLSRYVFRCGRFFTLQIGKYDSEILSEAVNATFENRQTVYTDNHIVFSNDFANNTDLNTRWNSFVKKLKLQQELTFPEVVGFLQTKLEPYWKKLK